MEALLAGLDQFSFHPPDAVDRRSHRSTARRSTSARCSPKPCSHCRGDWPSYTTAGPGNLSVHRGLIVTPEMPADCDERPGCGVARLDTSPVDLWQGERGKRRERKRGRPDPPATRLPRLALSYSPTHPTVSVQVAQLFRLRGRKGERAGVMSSQPPWCDANVVAVGLNRRRRRFCSQDRLTPTASVRSVGEERGEKGGDSRG